jgi:hypothetical protein
MTETTNILAANDNLLVLTPVVSQKTPGGILMDDESFNKAKAEAMRKPLRVFSVGDGVKEPNITTDSAVFIEGVVTTLPIESPVEGFELASVRAYKVIAITK